jgi:hypothetical protein
MRNLLIILLGLAVCGRYMDLAAPSRLQSVLLPLLFWLLVLALVVWLGRRLRGGDGSGGSSSDHFDGDCGDGGGSD